MSANSRRRAREIALKALYSISITYSEPKHAIACASEETTISQDAEEFAHLLVNGTLKHKRDLDDCINEFASGYNTDLLATVDLCILRLALFELLHHPETPPIVAIDEAIELAKKFSTEKSGGFVNGILGSVIKSRGIAKQEEPIDG